MAVNLTMIEPSHNGYIPARPFGLYESGVAIHEIMRLLTGSVNIKVKSTGKIIALTKNELTGTVARYAQPERIVKTLFSDNVTFEDYTRFVVAASAQNVSFFNELKRELVLCLISKKLGRYTESFLYLYRILEFVSLAFPFLYASTQREFKKSHDFLQSLMTNDRDGDLKVLERSLPILAREGDLHRVVFEFSIAGREVDFVRELRSQIELKVKSKVKGLEIEDEGDILFRVPFGSVVPLFVNLRNRMFHYRIGEPNMELGNLGGADRVCEVFVGELVHWFSLCFAEIVRTLGKRYI